MKEGWRCGVHQRTIIYQVHQSPLGTPVCILGLTSASPERLRVWIIWALGSAASSWWGGWGGDTYMGVTSTKGMCG